MRIDVWAVVVGSVVMFLLVVGRMNLAIEQIVAANRDRDRLQDDLAYQAAHDSLTDLPNRAQAHAPDRGRAQPGPAQRLAIVGAAVHRPGRLQERQRHATATAPATRCCAHRRSRMQLASGRRHRWPGSAATSSWSLLEPLDTEAVGRRRSPIGWSRGCPTPITIDHGREVADRRQRRRRAQPGRRRSTPNALLHEADVAVYRAKAGGRGRTEVFDDALRRELAERANLEAALVGPSAYDELVLHYQPIVDVRTGRVEGYEALVRWNRPGSGLLPPAEFIPIAEESDLICDLDTWVLHHAARQLAAWNRQPGAQRPVRSPSTSPVATSSNPAIVDDVS